MTINEIQDEIIEEFEIFDDWMDKYQLLIDFGNSLEPLDEQFKTDTDLYFIERIGLKEHLSPTRSNGLVSMVKQIRNYALAFKLTAQ